MFRSFLLRFPWLYELVQRLRDYRYHSVADKKGSFAQHGEDKILLDLLNSSNSRGPYVDVGCNHPVKLSNTFLLYKNGYRGLCIDPLPRFAPLFKRWRPKDKLVRSAVGVSESEMPLFEFEADVLSTLDSDLATRYRAAGKKMLRIAKTPVRRLDSILEENSVDVPISLLSIDIEGFELAALQSIDLERWKPTLICLEVVTADGKHDHAPTDYLLARGYMIKMDLGLNIIFKRG